MSDVDARDLSDFYLWHETAGTAEAIAHAAREGARIAEGSAAAANADARAALIAHHLSRRERLMHRYKVYQDELIRRYPELGQRRQRAESRA